MCIRDRYLVRGDLGFARCRLDELWPLVRYVECSLNGREYVYLSLIHISVFLRDPRLVVLDEASSRLDPATEGLLEQALDRLLAGRTGIVIAHRLRTVQRADDILILEGGRVVEHGPRAALAADPGSRFYQLLQTGLEEVLA